ncbi:MAG TPA: NAD(P)-dependent oxidoreductase [Chloroflexota bacterium]|nr:NAD(P)-dependent oxidoreductase [Chloroflexota bacterium]
MRLVVTGGLGKIGRWVVDELTNETEQGQAHDVVVFDRVPGPQQGPFQQGPVRYLIGDVLDLGQVIGALQGADAVIHLAALPAPGFATDDVTFRTNVLGTFNVHEAAARLGIRRVVSASSTAALGWVYRKREFLPSYLPIDENHPLAPQDAYGLSKQAGEDVARSYAGRADMETVSIRPPGVLTPEQMADLRAAGGRRAVRFGLGDYVDLRDLARAFRLAVERPVSGWTPLFVVADDSNMSEPLAVALPRVLPAIGNLASNLTGTMSGVSNARAKEVLGWKPRHSWRDAD